MTTAFTAEIDTPEGTRYLAPKSKLSKIPFFFRTVAQLQRALRGNSYRKGVEYFVPAIDSLKTVVVKVENLEKGLRSSSATRLSVAEAISIPSRKATAKVPSNAVFKIQFPAIGVGPKRKRFAGEGKYGKTWNRQGDVRLHIGSNIHWLKSVYRDATVVTILMGDDGITSTNISHTPIVEWYRRSPESNKRYLNAFSESMSVDVPAAYTKGQYA